MDFVSFSWNFYFVRKTAPSPTVAPILRAFYALSSHFRANFDPYLSPLPRHRSFFVKKSWITWLAFLAFFICGFHAHTSEARADNAVQFELLGKLGGMSNFIDKESFGDTQFDVAGGLAVSALFRFDMGVGIGLNFNWEMSKQRLELSQLTYALEARDRYATVQLPSFGFTFRYMMSPYFDAGFWINYGFGSLAEDMRVGNSTVASAYGISNANLKWNMQAVEVGIMGAFCWETPLDNLFLVIGIQLYADFARLTAKDSSLDMARDVGGRRLDENGIDSIGFNIQFGVRYDLTFSH